MKKLILFIVCVFFISLASALMPECQDEIYLGDTCNIITPAGTDCSTFDLVLGNGTLELDDATMVELIASTGIYNYTYTALQEGGHLVVCADNSSASFNVINYRVASEENTTAIITQGDSAWTTGTGNTTGVSCVNVDDKTGYTMTNPGNNTGAVCVAVEDKTGYSLTTQDWITSTDLNISIKAQASIDNETRISIISIGGVDWITATGFETESSASTRFTDSNASRSRIENTINALNDITIADVWSYAIRALTTFSIGDQAIATQTNATQEVNETLIADEIIVRALLANKTITYNTPSNLENVTISYDDFGWGTVEIFIYDDPDNKYYLNSSEVRRTS